MGKEQNEKEIDKKRKTLNRKYLTEYHDGYKIYSLI